MLRDHIRLLREYFVLVKPKRSLLVFNLTTALLYKSLDIARPFFAALIIKGLTDQDPKETYTFIIIYAVTYFFYRVARFFNHRAYSRSISDIYYHLQKHIYDKLILADENFSQKISRGRLMNTVSTDVVSIGEMSNEIAEYFTTILQIIATMIISATYSPLVALLMLTSSLLYLKLHDYSDKKYNIFWWKTQAEDDRFSSFLSQTISGLQEVRAFDMFPKLKQKLSRIQHRYHHSYEKQRYYANIRNVTVKIIYYVFQTVIYILLILLVAKGRFEVDILVLLAAYHTRLIAYVQDFSDAVAKIRLVNASVVRVKSILNYRGAKDYDFGTLSLDHLSGSLTLKNVSLTLNRQPILKDISLKIRSHEFVAIVGTPGAGKTMLFNLILRLKKPTRGKILLDNIDISEFSRDIYTSNVAVINQSPFIFNMSIRKNLDLVDTDIKRQIEACKIAGIHSFIETLPNGYNTILRENATNISVGQKQMISIARTILTDAEILLLDDVSSSLDPDTAKLIPRFIKRLDNERTIIMITKKPALMALADRIVVLDNGKISDIGTHEKLLKRSRIYRHLQTYNPPEGGKHV